MIEKYSWLAFFSCVANSRRKESQAEGNMYLIWTAEWSGGGGGGGGGTLPPDTQNTLIIFLSVIVVMKVQMIFWTEDNSAFIFDLIHSTVNSKS